MLVTNSTLAMKRAFTNVNMAATSRSLVVSCIILNICTCPPTTELFETVSRLLTDCSRFYPVEADIFTIRSMISF